MLQNNASKITPAEETLQPDYEIHCKFPKCTATYKNAGQYYMHCLRTHGQEEEEAETQDVVICCYYCPVKHCKHSEENVNNSFVNLRYLRQHYRKVHAVRKFNCKSCEKCFVTAKELDTHLKKECGQQFICFQCKIAYNSSAALLTHAKRKQHQAKAQEEPLKKNKKLKEKHIAIQTENIVQHAATQTTAFFSGVTVPVANICTQTSGEILHDLSMTESLLDVFDPAQMSQWTQTCDQTSIFNDQSLADTQTQTCWPVAVENDNEANLGVTMPINTDDDLDAFVSTETQTSFTQCLFDAATSTADIELDPTHSFDPLCMSQWTQTCESFLDTLINVQNTTFMNNSL